MRSMRALIHSKKTAHFGNSEMRYFFINLLTKQNKCDNIQGVEIIFTPLKLNTLQYLFTEGYFAYGECCEVDSLALRQPSHISILSSFHSEGYRSGHNEAVLKTVWASAHVGSNPTPSAKSPDFSGLFYLNFCREEI